MTVPCAPKTLRTWIYSVDDHFVNHCLQNRGDIGLPTFSRGRHVHPLFVRWSSMSDGYKSEGNYV